MFEIITLLLPTMTLTSNVDVFSPTFLPLLSYDLYPLSKYDLITSSMVVCECRSKYDAGH
jgi:hypothetical protein